ncbi:Uncharacterised protein family (UPF0104) [Candidatus Ornithobacterium hominis]|uniref:Uncharacterized protein n=1 Tax=Candidatus Ornithobacterium hominis TaxID=2497989 RepID=A0A383TUL0_9FLAO|nr:lysylphosphatidylglycerol synthase transmembrane domain-containing protein [Candidatus Ornithobacterium hominis]MCT7903699.1 flippase-like domain-containing protein [Candidatus Ornithobacterium hominis]SZD71037.1 Uncharacterised protein family (UPF0104) [Candidatus Ornithobacterium hominis]
MGILLKNTLALCISFLLAVVLIWFAFRGIDLERIKLSFVNANLWWIFISVALGIGAYWLRSERWKILLEPINPNISSKDSFIAICMNYFGNLIIPRSGELARCTSLYSITKTPVDQSFGTVITERVIDILCFGVIFLFTLFFNFDLVINLFKQISFQERLNSTPSWSILVGIFFIIFIFLFLKKIKKLSFYSKFEKILQGILLGLKSIQKIRQKKLFLLYTFLIWLAYFLMTYLIVFALPATQEISLAQGFYILFVGSIGMMIPASGGVGAYHAAMRLGFITLGFSAETGLAFGFLVHTPHTLISLFLGLLAFILNLKNQKFLKA